MITRLRSFDPRLLTILLIVFVQMLGASMALPILPLYAQRHFALEPQVITLLLTAFFGAQFLAGPFIGRLSDRYGRVPVLVISQVGTAIAFAMIAFADSAWVLFAARILDGITGGNVVVAQAYITDITPRDRRTEALGLIFAAFGLGFIFGPALGGILGAYLGERMPFLIAAVAATLTFILTHYALNETLTPEQRQQNRSFRKASLSPRQVMGNRPLLLLLLIGFGGQMGLSVLQSTFSLYGAATLFKGYEEQAATLSIGLVMSTIGVGQFITQVFLLKRLVKRYGEAMLIVIGAPLRAFAMFAYALVVPPLLAGAAGFFFALGMGLTMPAAQSLTTRTVEEEVRGGVLGLFQSAASLATIIGSAFAGLLFAITPTLPYWLAGILFLVMTLPALVILNQARARQQEAVAAAGD